MASRSLGTLTLDLIAKIGGFQQNMDRASQSVARTGAAADAAGSRVNALQSEFLSLSSIASRIAGPFAAAFSVNSAYKMTEAYSTLTNRLKLVTDGSAQLAAAQAAVFNIAQASAQPLSSTAELYARIATNQRELKLSGADLAGVVGTISKTLAVSGASAESANAALIQLGQAFASGVLRGEELNSVMEQAPALSQAIAAGMGKTVGQLRAMGAAGELTASAVVKAIQNQQKAVDDLFAKTATTIGNSFTKISNSMTHFVGELDQATGASARVSAEFVKVSLAIDKSLPGSLAALRDNSDALSQILTTGLYVALGRVAGGFAASAAAALSNSVANANLAVSNQAAAAAELRRVEVATVSAKNALQQALLNRSLAVTVQEVTFAENALQVAKTKALAMSVQLSAARGVEATATAAVAATTTASGIAMGIATRAATALRGAAAGMLALMGGPLGLLFITGAVAVSFMDFRSNADKAAQGLEGLKGPLDDVIAKFKQLTQDQKAAALIKWGEAEADGIKAANEEYGKLQKQLQTGLIGPRSSATGTALFGTALKEMDEALQKGEALGPVLRRTAEAAGLDPKTADSWVKQAGAFSDAKTAASDAGARMTALKGEMNSAATGAAALTGSTSGLSAGGEKYIKTLQDQLGKLQDNNDAVKEATRFLDSHKDLTEADRTAILSYAHAVKSQEEANKSATAATKESTSAIKANQKAFDGAKENYERQIELANSTIESQKKATESEKLAFETSRGKYAALEGNRKDELKGLAAELDAKNALIKADEDSKKLAAFSSNVKESNQSVKDGFDQQLAGAGQGDKRRGQLQEMLAIEQDFNKQQRELVLQRTSGDIDEGLYQKQTAILSEAMAERLVIQQDYYNQVEEAQSNWMDGVGDAWQNYVDAAENYSAIAADFVSGTLDDLTSGLGNAFADIATGASSIGDAFADMAGNMAKSVINALADMAAQWLVYQAVQLLVGNSTKSAGMSGLIANAQAASAQAALNAYASTAGIPLIGPAAAPAAALAAAAATAPMVAAVSAPALAGMAHNGMDNIPKEGTWLLDGGERVLNPNQNRDLTKYLADKAGSGTGGAPSFTINAPVNVQAQPGMTNADAAKQGSAISSALEAQLGQFLDREMRQGGRLWRRT
ncbi:phage tail tape measure protein [Pseudomonas syringae]|uniref:Phage tail tape measure protein n=1 Tax=Pseudomonas syringae pv. papulans TaxID=83963 RepID=A0A0P9XEA7_PSESX|nr:phage tail tape measure protein [Pseudomonas syringae]KPY29749.1 Tail tape measure protein [Pseudomonas syringae pv. papulans]KWS41963.1 hypothetical protein AL059_19685 [Pseudomonas syringae pv. papulans]MDH4602851.1 phage tail tape measure protein [Pseudomonas syringae pv. papulans]MDH4621464.1 phage tail tape measure protein [Pseudomonas syringae pv. papulans]RMN43698.1 Tail tape measure protein [Pseudomonas syringae pv. papulans]